MTLSNTPSRAACFAAVYALLRSSADVADHWVQTDHEAGIKSQRNGVPGQSTRMGRRACATHVASYVATQGTALLLGRLVLQLRLRPLCVALALALSATTHYIADRRWPIVSSPTVSATDDSRASPTTA